MRTSLQAPSQSQTQLRHSLWSKPTQPRSAFSSERLKTIWAEVPLPWRRGQKRVGPQCPWPRAPQAGSAPRTKPSLILFNSMDCSPPRSSVYGITQARIPEWVAISFSRRSSRPRLSNLGSPALQADSWPSEPPGRTSSGKEALAPSSHQDSLQHSRISRKELWPESTSFFKPSSLQGFQDEVREATRLPGAFHRVTQTLGSMYVSSLEAELRGWLGDFRLCYTLGWKAQLWEVLAS